jgi:hypothetical protein
MKYYYLLGLLLIISSCHRSVQKSLPNKPTLNLWVKACSVEFFGQRK